MYFGNNIRTIVIKNSKTLLHIYKVNKGDNKEYHSICKGHKSRLYKSQAPNKRKVMEKKRYKIEIIIEAPDFKSVLELYNKILKVIKKTKDAKIIQSICIEKFK